MKKISNWIIKFHWPIIVVFILITTYFASQIPKAQVNPDMLTYLPEGMDSRIKKARVEELFGGTEMIMVLVQSDDVLQPETLKLVKNTSHQMKRIRGIDKVMSLFDLKNIQSQDGAIMVKPAVETVPETEAKRSELREEIRNNDIVYGNVISEDFTLTAVIGMVETGVSDERLIGDIQEITPQTSGDEKIYIGGTPYSRYNTSINSKEDLSKLLPLGLLIMLLFLFICFKQLRGVLLPFLVVFMSILFSMGLIPLLGWQITVITIILPILLIAVANDYGIHMIAKYQEDNAPGNIFSERDLARRMFQSLAVPVLLTGITTMVGLLCLQGHILIPAWQLGILAAVGILFALAASLFFIPAVVSMLRKARPIKLSENGENKRSILNRVLGIFGHLVADHPKAIIIGILLFAVITAVGIFSVSVNTDPINYYEKDHDVAISARLINQNLGGFFPLFIVFEGDIKDPILMKKMDILEREIRQFPEVGYTMSIARVVRQMSRVMNDENEQGYDQIPDTRNAIAQYFELYMMSGDPDDFEKMVDFTYEHAVITVRLNTSSTPVLRQVVDRINDRVKNDPDIQSVGGIADVFSDLASKVVKGQFISLFMALVAVALLLMIFFRSFTAGFIGVIPLCISMLILFGLMGFLNIELNVATALLSSIMIGVGIDYTIHFLWRYKEERQHGLPPAKAASHTLMTTGRGIVFNAFSVIIGFAVLLFSSFIPVRFFGFLVVVSIFACLIGALVFVPAVCILLKPKFLELIKEKL